MIDWADFHFLRPLWLLALIPAVVLGALLARRRLQAGRWRDAVDPQLAPWLVESGWHRTARPLLAGLIGAWLLAVAALAGPTWERRPQPVAEGGDALAVALDLSLSMYAEDLAPSRLVRAKLKIADVLRQRADGLTGLVVFAGDAHVVVPPTDDVRTITNLLPALEPGIMPLLGSRPESGVRAAAALLDEGAAGRGRILLITDGVADPEAVVDAAGRYPVAVLGIGTAEGAPIPLSRGERREFLQEEGRTVIARVEAEPLARIAEATGGAYAPFTASDRDLARLLPAGLGAGGDDRRESSHALWIDAGPWLILPLLPLALYAFRRGVVAAGLLLVVLPLAEARAAPAEWFERPDRRAWEALREGRPEAASERFRDPGWRAVALYRAGDYERAAAAFATAAADDPDDAGPHYNRGVALAHAGRFRRALEAFDAALARDPEHADARHNRALVERLLDQRKQESANEQASQQADPNADDSRANASRRSEPSETRPGENEPRQGEAGRQPGQEREPDLERGEPGQRPEERTAADSSEQQALAGRRSREREQALEQWLRRVPDDPGALLERKFRYETERRYRRGIQRTPPEDQPW